MMRDVMRKLIFVVAGFLFFSVTSSKANDIYIAQSAAGAANGADCADARPVSSLAAGDWVAGNTIHLCGTISSQITAKGGGASGSPVTMLFESGAQISVPYCPTSGCIAVNGYNYVTIDGGANGLIIATANGGSQANQVLGVGVFVTSCTGCIVQNLNITNMYVHAGLSDEGGFGSAGIEVSQVTNVLISNNKIDYACFPIYAIYRNANGISGLEIKNNTLSNFNEGIRAGDASGSSSISGLLIHNNFIHDAVTWDDTNDGFHHNHMHLFAANSGSNLNNPQVYNNFLYGDLGVNETSSIYIEPTGGGSSTSPYCFNNVFRNDASVTTHVSPYAPFLCTGTNPVVANNTILNNSTTGALTNGCIAWGPGTTGVTERNNICSTFNYANTPNSSSVTYSAVSNNDYYNIASGIATYYNAGGILGMTQWQTLTGGDATPPTTTANPNVSNSSPFKPNSGSPVIAAGANLTSLGITALIYDINGVQRPSSGAWDMGAAQFAGAPTSGSQPNPPTGLVAVVQ
jgi:hypothetical protein